MLAQLDNLPATARMLVEHLGERLALKIIQTWPGLKFRVPQGIREDAPMRARLIETFGETDAEALIEHFAGEILNVPVCVQAMRDLRDQRIIDDYSAGIAVAELALRERLCTRQIENILKRTPGAPLAPRRRQALDNEDQLDLFAAGSES